MPAEFHEITASANNTLKYDFFSFHTENPTYLADLERIIRQYASVNHRIFHSDSVRSLIRNAIMQFNGPEDAPYRYELLSAQFLQIFICFVRHFKSDQHTENPFNATQAKEFCFSLMHYIDTHIYTMKNTSELAEVTNYNYSYLSNLFSSVTSQTLSSYFQKKRLETAASLLKEKELQITQISQMLQYSSLYAFSKAFRAYYGIAPRKYRQEDHTP